MQKGDYVSNSTLLDIAGTEEYVFRVDYFYELGCGYLLFSLVLIAVTKLSTSDLSSIHVLHILVLTMPNLIVAEHLWRDLCF